MNSVLHQWQYSGKCTNVVLSYTLTLVFLWHFGHCNQSPFFLIRYFLLSSMVMELVLLCYPVNSLSWLCYQASINHPDSFSDLYRIFAFFILFLNSACSADNVWLRLFFPGSLFFKPENKNAFIIWIAWKIVISSCVDRKHYEINPCSTPEKLQGH